MVPIGGRFCVECGADGPHRVDVVETPAAPPTEPRPSRTGGTVPRATADGAPAARRTASPPKPSPAVAARTGSGEVPRVGTRSPTGEAPRAPASETPRPGVRAPTGETPRPQPPAPTKPVPTTIAPPIGRITPAPRPGSPRAEAPPSTTRAAAAPAPTKPTPRPVTAPSPAAIAASRAAAAASASAPATPASRPAPAPTPVEDGPLAAPAGWPDITDELAEVRFLLLQGFEDEANAMLVSLRDRFAGHPDLEIVDAAPAEPPPIDPAEKRRRDQAVTVRTEPVAAAAAAAAADASRVASTGRSAPAPVSGPAAPAAPKPDPARPAAGVAAPPVGRNASRVPPRGLTIRSEPVDAGNDAAAPAAATPAVRSTTAPPDPSRLVATSPMPRPAPSPADSASETLEFDVDAEFADGDAAASSTSDGTRDQDAAPRTRNFEDSGETVVDLEFERLDRTVVSRAPPSPPVFDDEPTTDSSATARPSEPAPSEATPEGTVIARAPSAPAPWRPSEAPAAAPSRSTVIPTQPDRPPVPAPFGGAPPPGSTLVPGTTPPAGGFPDDDQAEDAATIALPSLADVDAPLPVVPSPTGPAPSGWSPGAPAVTGHTAPPGVLPAVEPAPPARSTRGGARGRGRKDTRQTGGVRIVMLGARGEAVAERTVEVGNFLDLGRSDAQPWSDDEFIEPMHARLIAAEGGVRVEELVPTGAVFLRIVGRRPLNEDDQVRVGQSLLRYRRPDGDPQAGPWGSVIMHIAPDGAVQVVPLGNSGVTIGREFGEVTLPGDTFVSSTHCRVVTDQNGIHIEDLDSSNGTYVRMRNGERIEVGQCVLIGQTQFVVRKR